MLDQHGADAPIHAAQCADALLAKGDLDGQAVWLHVLAAIEDLLSIEPAGPPH